TSPELGMKRLLAAGGTEIYQVTRAFRSDERGPLHNPEFTIVEWYRTCDSMDDGMTLLSDLANSLLNAGSADRIRYQDAFLQHAQIDPLVAETPELVLLATASGVAAPASLGENRDDWLDLLLVELVMPHLGVDRPVILYDYPASQAALAQIRAGDPPVAERFELFYRGVELANGYHELLDADELRHRSAVANRQRAGDGRGELPAENLLLAAMDAGLPACTGVAMGFDRLVMLAAGASTLDEVIAFPFERA
ncbi:MAG: elongation factor P--(R)-beta-lysine ligase, partial [Planctomycetales bacterium]